MARINNTYNTYKLIERAKKTAINNPEFKDELEEYYFNLLYDVSPYDALHNKVDKIELILIQRVETALYNEKN